MSPISPQSQDLAEPELLYNLGISLSAELNLPDLLNKVTDAAVSLTHAAEGQIILQDPDTAIVTVEAIREAGKPSAVSISAPTGDPVALHVLATGKSMLAEEGESLELTSGELLFEQSTLAVPLTTKGRTIGLLVVSDKRGTGPFSQHDQDMLAGLAGYAAIAIENARLYSQALDRTLQLSLLVESANALSWSLDLGRVLNAVARHMMRSLEATWCTIASWNPKDETLSRLAEYRLVVWKGDGGPPLSAEAQDYLSASLADGTYLSVDATDPSVARRGLSHYLAIPLQHEGKAVGLVEVSYLFTTKAPNVDTVRRCIRSALALAPILADPHVADNHTRLVEAARALTSTGAADFCTIYTFSPEAHVWKRVLDYGSGVWVEQAGPTLHAAGLRAVRIVLAEQRTAVIRRADLDKGSPERLMLDELGMGTQVLLPLVFKTKTVGLVQLYDPDPGRVYSERDMGLAYALANQAAVALENAHLVRDLQVSLERQKAMQGQLVRAARLSALGELTAVIAHQINNPLTTILGDAEMLVQDTEPESPLRDSAVAIQRAGERAKRVVERLLGMARSESEFKPNDLNHTIGEAVALVEQQLRHANIQLQIDLVPDLPPVRSIPGHLEDVWMNLIINARDAITEPSDGHGLITVTSRLAEDHKTALVTLVDNGTGIAPQDLERVFDPMFTTKPHGKGTGLGLYICRQIVTEHGGTIDVTSALGEGTHVIVRLPLDLPKPQGKQQWQTY